MDAVDRLDWHVLTGPERRRLQEAAGEVLATRPWVVAAWHHGSSAQEGSAARDIDLALVAGGTPAGPPAPAEVEAIAREMAERSGIRAVPFDVRVVNDADPVFLGAMLRGGLRIYEGDREARVEFEVRAMSLWLDFRPVWERIRANARRRWVGGG